MSLPMVGNGILRGWGLGACLQPADFFEFIDVDFAYEERQILNKVSFIAKQNEITALVGPSGAGKTTVARLIPRFWDIDAGEEEIIATAKAAQCHDFIAKLPGGYDTVVGEGGGKLSGGEKQRISIARAFLKDASIILLDEATANIDPENEFIIQTAINALVKDRTVIIPTSTEKGDLGQAPGTEITKTPM